MDSFAFKDGQAVKRMGFGAMRLTGQPGNWGPYPDKARAERVFRRALDLGVNFIDTAISYGAGHSEMLIADVLHPYPAGLMIATKGGFVKLGPTETRRDGSPANLRASCEQSLSHLKVETIDLYQYHIVDPDVPFADSIGALADLKREGKIKRVGLCNVSVEQIEAARAIVDIESVQNQYNLNVRHSEAALQHCGRHGIAFIPWGPFDAHAFKDGAPLAAGGGALDEVAARHGATPGQVALAWLLSRGPHVIPIPGTTSVDHLEENMAAARLNLTPEDLAALG